MMMKKAAAFLVLMGLVHFGLASTALAGTVTLANPDLMQCDLKVDDGYQACNIIYDQVLIFEGPTRSPADAGADCLICKNAKSAAKSQNAMILMNRQSDWNYDNFLTVVGADGSPVCH